MTTQQKLLNLLVRAKNDLKYWFSVANISSEEEFNLKKDEIKKVSYHQYNDIQRQINFIHKIEAKLAQ